MNKKTFYDRIRSTVFGGAIAAQQVEGLELILTEADNRHLNNEFLAYVLATATWESGKTMQPVREAFWVNNAEAWRKKNLRYYPYYGRGLVQLTWEFNYRKATDYFNKVLGIKVDFVKNPDLVMEPRYSVIILIVGMLEGWFTGKSLTTYLDGIDEPDGVDLVEFKKARRIVNGTDKDDEIAALALKYERALRASGRPEANHPTTPTTPLPDARPEAPVGAPESVSKPSLLERIVLLLIKFLKVLK